MVSPEYLPMNFDVSILRKRPDRPAERPVRGSVQGRPRSPWVPGLIPEQEKPWGNPPEMDGYIQWMSWTSKSFCSTMSIHFIYISNGSFFHETICHMIFTKHGENAGFRSHGATPKSSILDRDFPYKPSSDKLGYPIGVVPP